MPDFRFSYKYSTLAASMQEDKPWRIRTWHGFLLNSFDKFLFNLKYFFYTHENLFEAMFLITYLSEQLFLIYFFNFSSYKPELVIGFFTLLVLFTISLEKVLLKMRNKRLAEDKAKIENTFYQNMRDFETNYNFLTYEYNNLKKSFNAFLKAHHQPKNVKRK